MVGQKKISFKYRGKEIKINAKSCNEIEKVIGLMFKSREKAEALLFDFKKPVNMKIHSVFVFFPFVALWLDGRNRIIEIKKIKPFALAISPKKHFSKLIEIPINKKYKKLVVKLLIND